jgi:hypothetical protein
LNLLPAGRTGGDVGRNQLVLALLVQALLNFKGAETGGRQVLELQGFNPRPRRGLEREMFGELFNLLLVALDHDVNSGRRVLHPALQGMLTGKAVNEGSKSNPLDDSFQFEGPAQL